MTRPVKDLAFGKLGREIERFGNHIQRLYRASQKHRHALDRASAWTEGAAPLDARPESPAVALRAIDQYARIHREERAGLYGAYFAHHHLRAQAAHARELFRRCLHANREQRAAACLDLHVRSEQERRTWISALLDTCITEACPELDPGDYAVFNVGALTDHEDVDLAVVVSSVEAREYLDKAFAAVSKTFLRYASKLQLFLTEQLATPRIGGLVEEYEELLEKGPGVVVVMQLLGAQHLSGSRDLARAFRERVTERYYVDSGDQAAHETFLRAVMGELTHYQSLDRISELLAPKREIYIPAKLVIAAMRAIAGVREIAPRALETLAERQPERAPTYRQLRDAFVQNEILRSLLFLYVQKSDEVDLYESSIRSAARHVATLLGLTRPGRSDAEHRLTTYFRELRAKALGSVFELAYDLGRYVKTLPAFRRLVLLAREVSASEGNVAQRLLSALESLGGRIFWDEVVELLGSNRDLVARLLSDLASLPEPARRALARSYLRLVTSDPASTLELLILVGSFRRELDSPTSDADRGTMATLLWDVLLELLADDPRRLDAFVARLDGGIDPETLHRLASSYPTAKVAELADLIAASARSSRGERVVRTLRSVLIIIAHHSNAIDRVVWRVLGRTPEFIQRLADFERLRALGRDLLLQAEREPLPRERIELLGDSFDVQFLRLALMGVLGGAPSEHDEEYTQAFDHYLRELFRACARVGQRGTSIHVDASDSGIAVFATGGVGRREAFAADWDYLAITASTEPGLLKPHGKTLQRLEGALVRRGIVPHNRLTQRFNAYVVSVDQLRHHLANRTPETFIDEAEILEARFILGDPTVRRAFEEGVVGYVATVSLDSFLLDLLRELHGLRSAATVGLSLKHGPGGLRELQILALIVRAFSGHLGTPAGDPFTLGVEALPEHHADLRFLHIARTELRRLRDLYRLVVSVDDPIEPDPLALVAREIGTLGGAGDLLEGGIEKLMTASALRIDRIADTIRRAVGTRSEPAPPHA